MSHSDLPTDSGAAPAGTTGLPSNAAGALCYFLGALTGILFLIIEKKDPFVRFHAAQSIGVTVVAIGISITLMILSAVLGVVPILGWILGAFLSLGFMLVAFGFWLFLMFQAWQGRSWEVPMVGARAREMLLGGSHVA
jgi:uncharacterized membrane protein